MIYSVLYSFVWKLHRVIRLVAKLMAYAYALQVVVYYIAYELKGSSIWMMEPPVMRFVTAFMVMTLSVYLRNAILFWLKELTTRP